MKKKSLSLLCALLLVSAAVFAVLWRYEARQHRDLLQLWTAAAEQADLLLIEYQERGEESLLRQAAAELNVMRYAAGLLDAPVDRRTDLEAVYGILSLYPERGAGIVPDWIVTMEMAWIEGPAAEVCNWPVKMNELRHALDHP